MKSLLAPLVATSVLALALTASTLRVDAGEVCAWRGEALLGWNAYVQQCGEVRMADGVLAGTVDGTDSQLCAHVPAGVEVVPGQPVDIMLRTWKSGTAQLFWTTQDEPDPSEGRSESFGLFSDGEWHVYRLRPEWKGELKGLRLDFPPGYAGGERFEMAEVSLREAHTGAVADASKAIGVKFSLKMPVGVHYCSMVWRGDRKGASSFVPATDGRRHTYWFDLRESRVGGWEADAYEKTWTGTIRDFAVRQLRYSAELAAEDVEFVQSPPDIAADPVVTSVRAADAIPRAGRPLAVEVVVRNFGTRPADGLEFAFSDLPAGVRALDQSVMHPKEALPGFGGMDATGRDMMPQMDSERVFRFTLPDLGAGSHKLGLVMRASGVSARKYDFCIKVLPSLGLANADYPPPPVKVDTSPYEIGAFLFPGWTAHHWHAVWSHAPWRKPLLGWYDETSPVTIDWQIKHMAENGVSFVYVDWYWHKGRQHLNHWMDAFGSARYRSNLKWSVMWANHCPPGSHSVSDMESAARWWCDHFFADPQYRRVDGVPEVAIWSPEAMERDMAGNGGCRALLDAARRIAKDAGFGGIRFIALRARDDESAEYLKRYETMGFDATCCYRYLGMGSDVPVGPDGSRTFKSLVETSPRHWERIAAGSALPFMPSITTAWDDRPWNGERGWPVTGVNAADFRRLCSAAKKFSDEKGVRTLLLGPLDEWGEGSIGYPNAEHGFGLFEAVRDVFGIRPDSGWPVNYAPEDVGLVCPQSEGPLAGDAARHGSSQMNRVSVDSEGGDSGGMRVMFLGNSITMHIPADYLGWTNSWGMAASSAERDYVHLVTRALRRRHGRVAYFTKGMYPFESGWRKRDHSFIADAYTWRPDVVVVAIGENIDDFRDEEDAAAFELALEDVVRRFREVNPGCLFVVRGVFWANEAKDAALRRVAERVGAPFVPTSDLGAKPEMTAAGKFAHAGVAAHPGDAGMKEIAIRIFKAVERQLNENKEKKQ